MSTTSILRQRFDAVYEAFAPYRRPLALDASPLRDPEKLLRQLTSKPLRLLDVDDVQDYAPTALTTVGTVEDYKHFLPRLLELAMASGLIDPQTIALKLHYAEWRTWPKNEQQVLEEVFPCACVDAFKQHTDDFYADGWLTSLAMLNMPLSQVQADILTLNSEGCALQIAELMRASTLFASDPLERAYWGEVPDKTLDAIRSWLLSEEVRMFLVTARSRTRWKDDWLLEEAIARREKLIQCRPQ